MSAYTKLSYSEAEATQPDNLLHLSCSVLYNLDSKIPRIIATLTTLKYHTFELRIGYILDNEDFENLIAFITKSLNKGSNVTVTINDHRSFTSFMSKVKLDRHKSILSSLTFSFTAYIVNEDSKVLRNLRLHTIADISKNPYTVSFVSLIIRAM